MTAFATFALSVFRCRRHRNAEDPQPPRHLSGLALLIPSLGFLLAAQLRHSFALLVIGTTLGGVASALAYCGSLKVVNEIAPENQRAEVISSYLIACYSGNSVPAIGIGMLSSAARHTIANIIFAAAIAVSRAIALRTAWRQVPQQG